MAGATRSGPLRWRTLIVCDATPPWCRRPVPVASADRPPWLRRSSHTVRSSVRRWCDGTTRPALHRPSADPSGGPIGERADPPPEAGGPKPGRAGHGVDRRGERPGGRARHPAAPVRWGVGRGGRGLAARGRAADTPSQRARARRVLVRASVARSAPRGAGRAHRDGRPRGGSEHDHRARWPSHRAEHRARRGVTRRNDRDTARDNAWCDRPLTRDRPRPVRDPTGSWRCTAPTGAAHGGRRHPRPAAGRRRSK